MSEKRICKAIAKKSGQRCKAAAGPESDFCFFHDPAHAEERHEAQSTGGRQGKIKTLPEDTPDVEIKTCGDVVTLISTTISQVRTGRLDVRISNAIGYLCNVVVRAIEQSDIETRLAQLEALVKGQTEDLGAVLEEAA